MEGYQKDRILGCLPNLTENLFVNDVVPYLIQDKILTLHNVEEIESLKTQRERVIKLVSILTKKKNSCEPFFRALDSTGQEHVRQLILNSTPSSDSEQDSPTLRTLKDELCAHYCRQLKQLSPIPWSDAVQLQLDKVFIEYQIVRDVNRRSLIRTSISENESVGMAGLFAPHEDCNRPKKVLLEGEPGMGKSTLCCKLAYDWARGVALNSLRDFELVVLLKAKDLSEAEDQTLAAAMLKHLLPEDINIDADELRDCLRRHQEQILIIIDGYDEMVTENAMVKKLVEGKILSKCSLLVTSRPVFMLNSLKFFDSLLTNLGYSLEKQVDFVEKFVRDLDGKMQDVHKTFKDKLFSSELPKELCRNPLNLSILCLLLCEMGGDLPTTATELYDAMHSFLLMRAADKLQMTEEDVQDKCKPLFKVAFETLLEGQHQISESKLAKICDLETLKNVGFFTKEVKISRFSHQVYYNFTHKSFQEYFAAAFVAGESNFDLQKKYMKMFLQPRFARSAIFLSGMLKDEERLYALIVLLKDETYLPEENENERGIQFIIENHSSHLIFRCLSQITACSKVQSELCQLDVHQVCFSSPWCTHECVLGFFKFIEAVEIKSRPFLNVTVQMNCMEEHRCLYEALIRKVCSSPVIENLHMHQIVGAAQMIHIFETLALSSHRTLRSLELHFLTVASISLDENVQCVKRVLKWLKELKLKDCTSTRLMCALLLQIPDNSALENLHLEQCSLDEDVCQELCSCVSKLQFLRSFAFMGNVVHKTDPIFYTDLLKALEQCPLQMLSMSNLPSRRMMAQRGSIFPINEESSIHVSPAIRNILKDKTILHLDLTNTYLGESMLDVLCAVIKSKSQLASLVLRGCHIISPDHLDRTLMALNQLPNLHSLSLRQTELDENNFHTLANLIENTQTLKRLSLPAWIGSLDVLAESLHKNTSLERIELRKLQFLNKPIEKFALAVKEHPNLKWLCLGSNMIPPFDMESLILACGQSASLSVVKFVNFGLEREHHRCLIDMLCVNTKLEKLDIKGNKMDETTIQIFAQGLLQRPKLKYLNITQCKIGPECSSVIQRLRNRVILLMMDWF